MILKSFTLGASAVRPFSMSGRIQRSTAYSLGNVVFHPNTSYMWLECTSAGTTATSDQGINFWDYSTGETIDDGTVEWTVLDEITVAGNSSPFDITSDEFRGIQKIRLQPQGGSVIYRYDGILPGDGFVAPENAYISIDHRDLLIDLALSGNGTKVVIVGN